MRHEDKGDARSLLDLLELDLHILAQLEVKRAQRLIQKKNLRMVCQRTGNGDALLLATGQAIDIAVRKAIQIDHIQHVLHGRFDFLFTFAMDPHSKRHIVINIQMREQRILLENGVDLALVRWNIVDFLAIEKNIALVRMNEAADNPQGSGLSTSRRTKQGDKFASPDTEIEIFQNGLAIKGNGDVF